MAEDRSKHFSSKKQERLSVFRPVNEKTEFFEHQTDESPECHVRGLTGAFCPVNKALNLLFQKREELRNCAVKW